MTEREIEYEIIGNDKSGSRTFREVGDAAERAGKKIRKASSDFKKSGKEADDGGSAFEAAGKRLRRAFGDGIIAVSRLSAGVAGVLPLLGTATIALGKMAVAGYQLGVQLAPAAAMLPTMAAGAFYLKSVIVAIAPVMGQALMPVAKAWEEAAKHAGELGSRGLPTLGRAFIKVNFPAIRESMDRIAVAIGDAAKQTLRWANSAPGVKAIAAFTLATTKAAERLSPIASRVAISFANMVGRLSSTSMKTGTDAVVFAGEKLAKIMDSLSDNDVKAAIDRFKSFGDTASDSIHKVTVAFNFFKAHEATIKRVGDALAVFGIIVGIATGTWLPAIAGGAHLAFGHWDKFSSAVNAVKKRFNELSQNPRVKQFLEDLREQFFRLKGVVDEVANELGPQIQAFLRELGPTAKAVAPWIHALVPVFAEVGETAIRTIGDLIGIFLLLARVGMSAMRVVAAALRSIVPVFLGVVGAILNGAAKAFGWVPGIGPKLRSAAAQFNRFRDQVNNALNGIRRNISVQVNANLAVHYGGGTSAPVRMTYRTGSGGKASNLARAGGGPVIPGSIYRMAEQGDEMFVPKVPGRVLSASETARAAGGAGQGETHYHVYVTGAVVGDQRTLGQFVANAIRQARAVGMIPATAPI